MKIKSDEIVNSFFLAGISRRFGVLSFDKGGGAGFPAPPSAGSCTPLCSGENQRYLEQVTVHQQL